MALEKEPLNLQYLCEELKDNPEVVKLAMKKNSISIQYASKRLRSNIFFIEEIFKLNYLQIKHFKFLDNTILSKLNEKNYSISIEKMILEERISQNMNNNNNNKVSFKI